MLPLVLATEAHAATTPANASVTISPTTTGATSTVTNMFETTASVAQGGTITITSGNEPPGNNSVALPSTPLADNSDYTISYTTSTSSTPTSVSALLQPGSSSNNIMLGVGAMIPASATVTVKITNATNPAGPASVFLTDATSGDTTAAKTNDVSITAAAPSGSTVATVTDVNPRAVVAEGNATPFTLTGTFFPDSSAEPIVCFIPTANFTGAPPASSVSSTSCGAGNGVYQPTAANVTGTEIQGFSPALNNSGGGPDESFFVVVYNSNASSTGYQAASSTSAANEVMSVSGLDVIPETGVRVADTRDGMFLPSGSIGSGDTDQLSFTTIQQSMTLPSNIPSNATAVAMNVTAVDPAGPGNLQVFSPSGASCSGQSTTIATVNFQPGVDTSNYSIVPLGDGSNSVICITDNGTSVNVVLDVTGYTIANFSGANKRILDTRPQTETGGLIGPLKGGQVYSWPTGLAANEKIAVDVTAVGPTAVGNLRVFPEPSGGPPAASSVPNTAVVNYVPKVDGGSYYITSVGNGGKIDIYSDTSGTVNVVVDLYGTIQSSHVSVLSAPFRIADTRPGGIGSGQKTVVTASPSSPSGGGTVFIPPNAAAVIGSLADVLPNSVGNLRTFPDSTPVPDIASIANYPNQIRENLIMSSLNPSNGAFDIYSDGSFTNATFDATAYIS